MKTTRELSHQAIPGGERILMMSGIIVFACAIYLAVALRYHLHAAKPVAGVVSALSGPICFLMSVRELISYQKNWWTIVAVVTSGLAAAIAWGAGVLIILGRFS